MSEEVTSPPSLPDTQRSLYSKLSVSLVKRHEFCLLSTHQEQEDIVDYKDRLPSPVASDNDSSVILRLSWKLRVHGYLAKFVAACGILGFALEVLGGSATIKEASVSNRDRLASALRSAHTAEWVGFVMVSAGLVNAWVTNGRVSLLVAYWANLVAMVFTSFGLSVSCLLLTLFFWLRGADATQALLNASMVALFVLLAQLSGLLALLAHTFAYHPYKIFARANRLRNDSLAATNLTMEVPLPVGEV